MKKNKLIGVAVIFALSGLIAGLVLSASLNIETKGHTKSHSNNMKVSQEAVDVLSRTGKAMAELVKVVRPSVVNISTTRTIRTQQNPLLNDPFFRRFFGDELGQHQRERKATSLGSGVIVDEAGFILTNNHVVKGAEEITVTLADKRDFTGKVIGTDPKSDLAVVKIDAEDLPTLKWADSDTLRVGEMVIAIGSPFGLTQTVTSGIVSAVGRANVGIADYEDFIQTDAAINPGNSGGALVNARGELVGINTAIISASGGYQGIGFAIPSNMAKIVLENLRTSGKMVRGWLGVVIQFLSKELAEQFDLEGKEGVLIADVVEGSPAEDAAFRRGDLILEFNGKKAKEPTALRNIVAATPPDTEVDVKIIRDGQEIIVKVTIGELPEDGIIATAKPLDTGLKGIRVQELTPDIRKQLDVPARITGVIVSEVEEGSPAAGSLTRADVIVEINRHRVRNLKEFERVASEIAPGQRVLLLVYRNGTIFYLTLTFE